MNSSCKRTVAGFAENLMGPAVTKALSRVAIYFFSRQGWCNYEYHLPVFPHFPVVPVSLANMAQRTASDDVVVAL